MTMISERIRVTDSGQPGDEPGQQELVSSALATLSREDQEIIELTVRHGLSGADLADVLGVPPQPVAAGRVPGPDQARLGAEHGADGPAPAEVPARSWPAC